MSSSIKLLRALTVFYEEYIEPFDANSWLLIIAILTVGYFAWLSTEIQEFHRAILIFDNQRFRRHNSLLVSVFSTASHQAPQEANQSPSIESQGQEEGIVPEVNAPSPSESTPTPQPPSVEEAIDEVYSLSRQQETINQMTINSLQENIENVISETFQDSGGPQEIIRQMDRRNNMELRYRPSTSAQARSLDADNSASTENCSNENSENEQISKIRSNVGESTLASASSNSTASEGVGEFTVKLKYLNDDIKIVKALPTDVLKDFKSKNFKLELAAQKIIRLVFNGQVLSPDSKTLQSCGLFDNCVVHCLVHNKKIQAGGDNSTNSTGDAPSNEALGMGRSSTNRNANGNGFLDLLSHRRFNAVFNCLSCLTVLFCWFCRFEYSYLFNIYSTIGLILITVMLIFMLPIVYLMDWD